MRADVCDLGRMSYSDALAVQLATHQKVIQGGVGTLLLVEHDPVLTLGSGFHAENLLFPASYYEEQGIARVQTDRGGDITYHGPGQLTIYPIFSLDSRGRDVHRWLRDLEETQLQVLAHFELEGTRFPPHTGVWCGGVKVAAIGVKIRKWVSLHGVALNCDLPLDPFGLIVPCGIRDHGVGSLTTQTGRPVSVEEAKPAVIRAFSDVFELEISEVTLEEVLPEQCQT